MITYRINKKVSDANIICNNEDMVKTAEKDFAPGIPKKQIKAIPIISGPTLTKFSIQTHNAARAGKHFDLRLAYGGDAHSWAVRKWPKNPGDKSLAILQPTHSVGYMTWSGTIPGGYGAGTVSLHRQGDAEIISSGPDKIKFVTYDGDPQEYTLIRMQGTQWLLLRNKPEAPSTKKPKLKSLKQSKVPEAPQIFDALSAKLDGAHAAIQFGSKGSQVRVFSPRISKRTKSPIEYTHKIPGVLGMKTPSSLTNTVVRGEVLAVKGRNSMGHTATASILNTKNVLDSRRKQRSIGKLKIFPFKVDVYKGKDVRNAPPQTQLSLLKQVTEHTGWKTPEIATSPTAKKKLFERIQSGAHPMTNEGVVGFNLDDESLNPVKIKFRKDTDVIVRDIFPSRKSGLAGGFLYSMSKNGPVVGRVGTGFDHATLKDMRENPQNYIGQRATVLYQEGGKKSLRAPTFLRWHLG